MDSSLMIALLAAILINTVSADYHILTIDGQDARSNDPKESFQSHFRSRRSVPDANDIMMDFIQEDAFSGSGDEVSDIEVTTKVQTFQFYVKNTDTKTAARATLSELMPHDAVLMEFMIQNQGKTYQYNGHGIKTLEKASEEFENSISDGLSAVMVGDVQIASERCSDCRSDNLDGEAVAAVINIAPGDVLSVTLSYSVSLTRQSLQKGRELYRTDVTIDLDESATKFKGVLMSPNYPDEYPNNADLTWLIEAPTKDMTVTANLLSFNSESCCDHLYIYDGPTDTSPTLDVVSGDSFSTDPVVTSGSSMLVKFQSDFAYNGEGFALEFFPTVSDVASTNNKSHVNTNLVLTDIEGIIETPGYPKSYPSFSTLVWTIKLQPGFYVGLNLEILDFNVMSGDNLVIFDDISGNNISALSSGLSVPYYMSVSSNQISLVFTTHQMYFPSRGFYIQYAGQEGINTNVISMEENDYDWKTLYSPNYPDNYENNEYLIWIITAPSPTDLIRIEIASLHLESGYDWLLIYNGNDTENENPMGSLSGSGGSSIEYITTVNSAKIVFETDDSVTDQGFEINYKIYRTMKYCSAAVQTIAWSEGLVTNSEWPNYQYYYNDCQWLITVAPGKVIEVFLGQFSSSSSNITFYDGDNKNGAFLWSSQYEDFGDAIAFQSSSYKVLAVIEREYSGSSKFSFRFQEANEILQSCDSNIILDSSPGQIKSLMYPRNSPPQTDCRWFIQAPVEDRVMLTIQEINLGYNDSVAFFNENENSIILGCGSYDFSYYCSEGQTVFSETNVMIVSSNISSSYSNFKFLYKFLSSKSLVIELDDYSGAAISPNFPNFYPNNYYHVYHITVAEGSIYLNFDQFNTESCCDFLYIYDGNSTSSNEIARLSGSRNGYGFQTSGRYLTMEFDTDGSVTDSGFQMSYSVNNVANHPSTEATSYSYISLDNIYENQYLFSPGAPGYYPNNADFIWYIKCNEANYVYYQFYRMDIDSSDFVHVYEGLGINDENIMRVYNGVNNFYYYSGVYVYGPSSTLWFHSDSDYSGLGFYSQYQCE